MKNRSSISIKGKFDVGSGSFSRVGSAGCESSEELFNIATLRDDDLSFVHDEAPMILDHPQCDRATAPLVYWKLVSYSAVAGADSLQDDIATRIAHDVYPVVLAYDPAGDLAAAKLEPVWEIPAEFFLPISPAR